MDSPQFGMVALTKGRVPVLGCLKHPLVKAGIEMSSRYFRHEDNLLRSVSECRR